MIITIRRTTTAADAGGTDFAGRTKLTIVTWLGVVSRRLHAGVQSIVASTRIALVIQVTAVDRGSGLTIVELITGLDAVAVQTIITKAVVWETETEVLGFITGIDGTSDKVVAVNRGSSLAIVHRVTGLDAVAEETVVAQAVVRCVHTGIGILIAGIDGAGDRVVTNRGRSRKAYANADVTGLGPVAEQAVIAPGIAQAIHALIDPLVTLHARKAGIRTVDAVQRRIANLVTITEQAVATEAVIRGMVALIGVFVAGVDGTGDTVTAIARTTVTTGATDTDLCDRAEQVVIARLILIGCL